MSLDGEGALRMRDLCERTGLDRQTIHFYIREGLVPEGKKTGANTAVYGEAHVERIGLVRQLARERMLPLKAIRAALDGGEEDALLPEQRVLVHEIRGRLPIAMGGGDAPGRTERFDLACRKLGIEADADAIRALGILRLVDKRGVLHVRTEEKWLLELAAELRRIGFGPELGFTPAYLKMYTDVVERLFDREKAILFEKLGHLPPDDVARLLARAMPLVGTLLSRYHGECARRFFSSVAPTPPVPSKQKSRKRRSQS